MSSQPTDVHRADMATLATESAKSATISSPVWAVTVIEGPDSGKCQTIDLSSPTPFLVGKSPACHLILTDQQVSRRHAALELEENHLRLRDLGSTNGTLVRGLRIVDAYLEHDDVVRLGGTCVRVNQQKQAAAVPVNTATSFGRVIGASPEMRRLYPVLERLASTDLPVLIEGETGTGKELLAESIHECGPRADKPFVVFDCTAVAANLMESSLFGHERGAFTGAVAARRGVFEQAHTGTLFIDEIGELEYGLQAKLLRAIERSEFQRVGSDRWQRVDVRIVSATRRDLDREIQEGRFRDDLFFRLAVARVELPPLRKRHGDTGVLARHFWKQFGGDLRRFPYRSVSRLESNEWPGNVRELHNLIMRWMALGDFPESEEGTTAVQDTFSTEGDFMSLVIQQKHPLPRARALVVDEFERRYVESVVAEHGGSISAAARASGIALRYFQLIRARRTK